MKTKAKTLLVVGGLAVGGVLAGIIGLRSWIHSRLTPDALVREMEARWNCRAHVGASTVDLLASPARLVLEDVRILPRDEAARSKAGPGDRGDAPPFGTTGVVAQGVTLEADLWPLVSGEIRIRSILLRQPELRTVVRRDGGSSISEVFDEPVPEAEAPVTATAARSSAFPREWPALEAGRRFVSTEEPGDAAGAADKGEAAEPEEDALARFHVSEIPLPATLDTLSIADGSVSFAMERAKGTVRLHEISADMTEIDIDGADLANRNSTKLALRTRLAVEGRNSDVRYADLALSTEGEIIPFDPGTGFLNPDMVYDLTIHQGSAIDSWPVLEQLAGSVKELEQAGVELREILGRTELAQDASLRLRIHDGRIGLAETLSLPFEPYALTLNEGAWVRTADNSHSFEGTLTASETLTGKAIERMDETIKDKAGDTLAEIARELLVKPLLRDGRIALDFRSTGTLSKPKVRIDNPLKDLGDVLEEAGKNLFRKGGAVDSLLKGLFGK